MSLPQPELQARIGPAETGEASALTNLALTSKAVWGYDAVFMAACRAELTVHPDSIRRDPTYLIEADGRILGFYQLRTRDVVAEVSMMFVAPEALRSGVGRRLWAHLEDTARRAGATRLEVDSDPHAEGFYLAMGMRLSGDGHAPPRLSGGWACAAAAERPRAASPAASCRMWRRSSLRAAERCPHRRAALSPLGDPDITRCAKAEPA
jgi:GNAT superfamily N-acetyltransferase